jgi:hypothetical protein
VTLLKPPEQRAADELTEALLARLADRKPHEVASLAHVQAILTKSAVQAVVDLLVSKGVFSDSEMAAALKYHYNRSNDQLVYGANGADKSIIARPQ